MRDVADVPVNPPQQQFFIKNSHPVTQALRQTGDPRLYELPGTIATRSSPERSIRFGRIPPRPRDTHAADQHVTKLRKLVQAPAAQKSDESENFFVTRFCLPGLARRICRRHHIKRNFSIRNGRPCHRLRSRACSRGPSACCACFTAIRMPSPGPAPPTFSPPRQKP